MGEIGFLGDKFSFQKVSKIKVILMDKEVFPNIVNVVVNEEDQGFGYFSINWANTIRRTHIHWYELVVRILPSKVLKTPEKVQEFYRRVFYKSEEPVNLLFHFYKHQQNDAN